MKNELNHITLSCAEKCVLIICCNMCLIEDTPYLSIFSPNAGK